MAAGDFHRNSVERLRNLRDKGAFFEAAELAERLLKNDDGSGPGDDLREEVTYLHIICVASSGSLAKAQELYDLYNIEGRRSAKARGLGARLAKAQALIATGPSRASKLRAAAQSFETSYFRIRGRIGGVNTTGTSSADSVWTAYQMGNAATLHFLAGDHESATEWATGALEAASRSNPEDEREGFFRNVIAAEASLIIGDTDEALRHLDLVSKTGPDLYAHRARRYAQMTQVCNALGISPDILNGLKVPDVIYYAGHIISPPSTGGRFPAEHEEEVREDIHQYLSSEGIGIAFGSLAAGADILFAEAAIDLGIDLHVILPFDEHEFLETSVRPSGGDWEARFQRCLRWCRERQSSGGTSLGFATQGGFFGDGELFTYGSRYALGLAMLRARNLNASIRMVAAYDGNQGSGIGTYGSIKLCERQSIRWDHINIAGGSGTRPEAPWRDPAPSIPRRRPLAVLFGDVENYSELREEEVPIFHEQCLKGLLGILEKYSDQILDRNSWGDSIFLVMEDAISAIHCALEIQNYFSELDFRALGLSRSLALRLGCHFGPVFHGEDYVRGQKTFYGSHVMRAARIEPITPPGDVYVTEPMAAALALEPDSPIVCDYVGLVPLPKNAGELRLYLARTTE